VEVLSHGGILFTVLISLYYLRIDAGLQQCVGRDDVYKLEDLGMSCGALRASRWSTEVSCTFGLLAVNILVVGVFVATLAWLYLGAWQRSARAATAVTAAAAGGADNAGSGSGSTGFSSRALLAPPRAVLNRIVLRLPMLTDIAVSDKPQSSSDNKVPNSEASASNLGGAAGIAARSDGASAASSVFNPLPIGSGRGGDSGIGQLPPHRQPGGPAGRFAAAVRSAATRSGARPQRAAFAPVREEHPADKGATGSPHAE